MPWNQTEELFKSTLKAATELSANDDAWSAPTPKYETVDLGEAGRQEIWETGAARIEKLIAKHGGKQSPPITERTKAPAYLWRAHGALRLLEIASGDRRRPSIIRRLPKQLSRKLLAFSIVSFHTALDFF